MGNGKVLQCENVLQCVQGEQDGKALQDIAIVARSGCAHVVVIIVTRMRVVVLTITVLMGCDGEVEITGQANSTGPLLSVAMAH